MGGPAAGAPAGPRYSEAVLDEEVRRKLEAKAGSEGASMSAAPRLAPRAKPTNSSAGKTAIATQARPKAAKFAAWTVWAASVISMDER